MSHLSKRLGVPIERYRHIDDTIDFDDSYPLIITVRDPMLSEISRINRREADNIRGWKKLATYWDRPNTHWFRLDTDDRPAEMEALRIFLGATQIDDDWTPIWTSKDPHDHKGAYRRGEIPTEAQPAFNWLKNSVEVQQLFTNLEYNLPWMVL